MERQAQAPCFDIDFWSEEVLLDPYPYYRELRALGPAVWLSRHDAWALTRYDAVRQALLKPDVFSSAQGCMMNAPMNAATQGIMLCSDDPEHLAMRRLFARPLLPKELAALKPRLEILAVEKIEALLGVESFDAVSDLAHYLPLTVVTELVGLDAEGREKMLHWAAGMFNAFGPGGNRLTIEGFEIAQEVVAYVMQRVDRANLISGGWGEALFIAADKGQITEQTARLMLIDYLTPSLDTTINATSAAIALLAEHPVQWDKLRADPSLIPHAINEVIRFESPIRAFARSLTRDWDIDGIRLEAGSRALMLYGCANRDDRKFANAELFNIERRPSDHLGFGMGTHICAGMHLAKLEITVLLEALLPRVRRFHVQAAERRPHNTLRGFSRLDTRLETDEQR